MLIDVLLERAIKQTSDEDKLSDKKMEFEKSQQEVVREIPGNNIRKQLEKKYPWGCPNDYY